MSAVALGNSSASGRFVTRRAYDPAFRKIEPGNKNQFTSTVNIKKIRPILSRIAQRLLNYSLSAVLPLAIEKLLLRLYLDKKQP